MGTAIQHGTAGHHLHRWQDVINLILGAWLFVTPWFFRASMTATTAGASRADWNMWILGVIVFVVSICAISNDMSVTTEVVNAIAGAWLFFAPWILSFTAVSMTLAWNAWIVGVIVFVLACLAVSEVRRMRMGGMSSSS